MNILIPMAGAGSRFSQKDYTLHKPILPLTSRHSHKTVPMVVEAVRDLPVDLERKDVSLVFIVRDFHIAEGIDQVLLCHFPRAQFIVIDTLTDGQASTCLHSRSYFDTDLPLMISACDNGIDISQQSFEARSQVSDALVFSFRGNKCVSKKPESYGWLRTDGDAISGLSIKKPISDEPQKDHAIVGTFWFKSGRDFFDSADKMIAANDRINGEFYVDQVFKYLLKAGRVVRAIEVDRYISWGTPDDYESYHATLAYWTEFISKEAWVK
jgi:dTDP-glucose pyrophosphorylase